jgi:hypothetical protein
MAVSEQAGGAGLPHPDVPPAPGGTLAEYAGRLKSQGVACALTAGGSQLWIPGARGELMRLPMTCSAAVESAAARDLLRLPGVWVLSYLVAPGPAERANCFLYVCRDAEYHMDRLRKNARKVLKRGLRNFVVRRCTWDEIAEKGYAAKAETDERHGYPPPPRESVPAFVGVRRHSPFHEAWGAWRGDDLAAWITLVKVDQWAEFEVAPSRTAAMPLAPNNILRYECLRSLLGDEKRSEVVTGVSAVRLGSDQRAMHEYNTRIGFEAIPMRRVFLPHPLLAPFLRPRLAYAMLRRLSAARPASALLAKAAGMAGVLSGGMEKPLAWADAPTASDENGDP